MTEQANGTQQAVKQEDVAIQPAIVIGYDPQGKLVCAPMVNPVLALALLEKVRADLVASLDLNKPAQSGLVVARGNLPPPPPELVGR